MQSQFPWEKPLLDEEVDAIFTNGIITFDANVLLDIYRVDKETRQEIKKSIEQFKTNLWISHQAAFEFLKNKNKVEIGSKNIFFKYISSLKNICDNFIVEISKVQSQNHTSNKSIQEKMNEYISSIKSTTEQITTDLENNCTTYKDELNDEKTLEWIFSVFEGNSGEPFPQDILESLYAEADERIARNIPPGYKDDDDKDGPNKYGDFLLWKQLLNKSKHENKPVVFVTSEKKEDWFEKISGQIIQPRRELLEESMRETSQRFLIFRTGSFLKHSARLRSDGKISENTEKAIEEIENLQSRDDEAEAAWLLNKLAPNCPSEAEMEKYNKIAQQYKENVPNFPSEYDIEKNNNLAQQINLISPNFPSEHDMEKYNKIAQQYNAIPPSLSYAYDLVRYNNFAQQDNSNSSSFILEKELEKYNNFAQQVNASSPNFILAKELENYNKFIQQIHALNPKSSPALAPTKRHKSIHPKKKK